MNVFDIKKLSTLVCLLLINTAFYAQGAFEDGLEFNILGGVSIPLGDFADKALADWNEHCGCAKTAGSFELQAKMRVAADFFVVGGFQTARNIYDPKPITKALRRAFDAPFSTETDSWKTSAIKLGGGYSFALGEKLNLFFEAAAVLNSLDTYMFRIQSPDGSNRYPLLQKSVTDTGFGYALGTDFTYEIFDGFGASFAIDYMTSQHTIAGADRRYNGGDLIAQNYKQKVEMVLVQVGVFIRAFKY